MSIVVEQPKDCPTKKRKPFPGETRHDYYRRMAREAAIALGLRKPRLNPSRLAKATFHALKPFINIYQCGKYVQHPSDGKPPGPRFMIGHDKWDLLAQYYDGKQPRNKNGALFQSWHVTSDYLAPKHIHLMLDSKEKYYYTGGREGLAISMVDLDAHEEWQDDLSDLYADVEELLGKGNFFFVESSRGINLHLKIDYRGYSIDDYNEALDKLQKQLKRLTARRKSLVEIKGKIGCYRNRGIYGTQAKPPCYGHWNESRLEEFKRLPVKPLSWLLDLIAALEKREDLANVKKTTQRKKAGSCFYVAPEIMNQLPAAVKAYKQHAYYLYSMRVEPRRKDVKLTALDFQQALAVCAVAGIKPQKDGSLPQKYIKCIWNKALEMELFTRAFCDSRWSAIWKTLADCGYLDVTDTNYWHDEDDKANSQCMRWNLRQEYSFFSHTEQTSGIIATGIPAYRPNVYRPTWVPASRSAVWHPTRALDDEEEELLANVCGYDLGKAAPREG